MLKDLTHFLKDFLDAGAHDADQVGAADGTAVGFPVAGITASSIISRSS